METMQVVNDKGLSFNVVYNRKPEGDVVSFHDDRYRRAPQWKEHGQHVSSYYAGTLLGVKGFHGSSNRSGLNLDGGIPDWSIDHDAMQPVYEWIEALY